MHVEYNDVPLEIVTIDRLERRAVLSPDETTVLYNEWSISLSTVYHPELGELGGTSVKYESEGERDPAFVAPTNLGRTPKFAQVTFPGPEGPIYTDRELLLRLSIPRKLLRIYAFDANGEEVEWLRSPRYGPDGEAPMPRDAKIGPIVQAQVVTANLGNAVTFGVQLEIKTWLPPCPDGSDRLILGHRWQTVHTQDENYYLTRAVAGEIWFNGGVLDEFGVRADVVARELFHPIPLGFRRFMGPVTQSPDGLVLRYSFSDVDQKVVFDPGDSNATTIVINENVMYRVPFQGQEILADFGRTFWDTMLFGPIRRASDEEEAHIENARRI